MLNKAAEFYHKALFNHPEGRAYLQKRGLHAPALLEAFRIGYANGAIFDALPPEGDLLNDLKATGILSADGREHFQNCVVFPIHDAQGNVVGMYGRNVNDQVRVKHLYLPGPHRGVWNRAGARSFKNILLTESIIDAATLWQAGYKNALACYGTNGLTEEHLQLCRENQTEAVYLVMDGDDAVEFMLAGASAVAVGTAIFADPYAPLKVIDGINAYLERQGCKSVKEIIGGMILK